eukprot:TRINITY_DN78623_c0_g1_i1.p1 TRINITY_DN78623_c0_g1~~TRINITY_DN78623_c0_g1_i1.p1  ORF type:complete len:605 (-),score=137.00 TRINITY_DN78623_c0_g1_i1:111-1925(-)
MAAAAESHGAGPGEPVKTFLVLFAHHNMYFNMRFQELEALAALLGVNSREELYGEDVPTALSASPLALIRLPGGEAAAKKLCERAVLIKAVLEVWCVGKSCKEVVDAVLAQGSASRTERRRFLAPPTTVQIRLEAFGSTLSMEDKGKMIETLAPLFDGDEVIDLRSPETVLWVLEEHKHQSGEKTHLGPRTSEPDRVLLGRQVAGGRSVNKKLKDGDKCFFHRYDLSQRAVLGPTTLENELAFIMANCALAQSGRCGQDPFCGTGGLLVAMGHFGVQLFGGEIDIRVVKGWRIAYTKNKDAMLEAARSRGLVADQTGSTAADSPAAGSQARPPRDRSAAMGLQYLRDIGLPVQAAPAAGAPLQAEVLQAVGQPSKKANKQPNNPRPEKDAVLASRGACNIFTNFVQYRMPKPEVVVCDNAMPPWREVPVGWLDFIVTDPPYGVRAASKKQGREPGSHHKEVKDLGSYIPSKVSYGEDELSRDLLEHAAQCLVDGGRLVFLVPVDLADFLGIDRAATERGDCPGQRETLHDTVYPKGGRKKDPRLNISETTRDPLLLDEKRYEDFIPQHAALRLVGASLQVLSGGLGRLLVSMQRLPRGSLPAKT